MSNQTTGQKFAFCPIWQTKLLSQRRVSGGLDPKYELNNPRAGGKYTVLSSFAKACDTNEQKKEIFNLEEKLVLSAWIAKENLRGNISVQKRKSRGGAFTLRRAMLWEKTSLLYGHATRRCQRIWLLTSVNTTACFGKRAMWRLFPTSSATGLRTPSAKGL